MFRRYYHEIVNFLVNGTCWPEATDFEQNVIQKRASKYKVINGVLYHKGKGRGVEDLRLVPTCNADQLNAIRMCHLNTDGNHYGINKTASVLSAKYYWRMMYTDVLKYVQRCPICIDKEGERWVCPKADEREKDNCWKLVEIELLENFHSTRKNAIHVLRIVDVYSNWTCYVPLSDLSEKSLVKGLLREFASVGFPLSFRFINCKSPGLILKRLHDELINFSVVHGSENSNNFAVHVTMEEELNGGLLAPPSTEDYLHQYQEVINKHCATLYIFFGYHRIASADTQDWFLGKLTDFCKEYPYTWTTKLPYLLFSIQNSVPPAMKKSPFSILNGRSGGLFHPEMRVEQIVERELLSESLFTLDVKKKAIKTPPKSKSKPTKGTPIAATKPSTEVASSISVPRARKKKLVFQYNDDSPELNEEENNILEELFPEDKRTPTRKTPPVKRNSVNNNRAKSNAAAASAKPSSHQKKHVSFSLDKVDSQLILNKVLAPPNPELLTAENAFPLIPPLIPIVGLPPSSPPAAKEQTGTPGRYSFRQNLKAKGPSSFVHRFIAISTSKRGQNVVEPETETLIGPSPKRPCKGLTPLPLTVPSSPLNALNTALYGAPSLNITTTTATAGIAPPCSADLLKNALTELAGNRVDTIPIQEPIPLPVPILKPTIIVTESVARVDASREASVPQTGVNTLRNFDLSSPGRLFTAEPCVAPPLVVANVAVEPEPSQLDKCDSSSKESDSMLLQDAINGLSKFEEEVIVAALNESHGSLHMLPDSKHYGKEGEEELVLNDLLDVSNTEIVLMDDTESSCDDSSISKPVPKEPAAIMTSNNVQECLDENEICLSKIESLNETKVESSHLIVKKIALAKDAEITLRKEAEITLPKDAEITLPKDAEITLPKDAEITLPKDAEITLTKDAEIIRPNDAEITPLKDAFELPLLVGKTTLAPQDSVAAAVLSSPLKISDQEQPLVSEEQSIEIPKIQETEIPEIEIEAVVSSPSIVSKVCGGTDVNSVMEDVLKATSETCDSSKKSEILASRTEFVLDMGEEQFDIISPEPSPVKIPEPKKSDIQDDFLTGFKQNNELAFSNSILQASRTDGDLAKEYDLKALSVILNALPVELVRIAMEQSVALRTILRTDLKVFYFGTQKLLESKVESEDMLEDETPIQNFDLSSQTAKRTSAKRLEKRSKLLDDRDFKCPVCPKTYLPNKDMLELHLTFHCGKASDVKNLLCPLCQKPGGSWQSLLRHYSIHEEGRVKLKELNVDFPNKSSCTICGKIFSSKEAVTIHIQKKHPPISEGQSSYQCDVCQENFIDPKALKRHKEKHAQVNFKCSDCEYSTATGYNYIMHRDVECPNRLQVEEKNETVEVVEIDIEEAQADVIIQEHPCLKCKKVFLTSQQLDEHIRTKHPVPVSPVKHAKYQYRCDHCPLKFKSLSLLSAHILSHEELNFFVCKICDYKCKTKNVMKRHAKQKHPTLSMKQVTQNPNKILEDMQKKIQAAEAAELKQQKKRQSEDHNWRDGDDNSESEMEDEQEDDIEDGIPTATVVVHTDENGELMVCDAEDASDLPLDAEVDMSETTTLVMDQNGTYQLLQSGDSLVNGAQGNVLYVSVGGEELEVIDSAQFAETES